ncbi:HET-domain-containing protein [Amniculicola lignicola CBS 123094]|uniref:HET-domain-containing protein n=1 Tax=Amniculicola lignicola CBS 123094 TaxID=1392246 RepID=A0A6A5WLE8_9PLEO|nr:HET-domain-containing protein [Amniculicola lignicola CBS 123094]
MSGTASTYQHGPLLPGLDSVRLLRLLPLEGNNKAETIHCELANYKLGETGEEAPQYEALSYVWGDCSHTRRIMIHGQPFNVTVNLYAALLRLRERGTGWIWIDGICINQKDQKERGHQVRYMAKIYGKAYRVVVWLGEEADHSPRAFEAIRSRGSMVELLDDETIKLAVLALLRRSWFRRIWILQEVAAARRIEIICGEADVDGYRFCVGLKALQPIYKPHADIYGVVSSVMFLIRQANFRPTQGIRWEDMSFLAIRPLGELIDMYNAQGASDLHDKIYALLGMRSDTQGSVEIIPDYHTPWSSLFHRVAEHFFSMEAYIHTWDEKETAVIRAMGKVVAKVTSIVPSSGWTDSQKVDITSTDLARYYEDQETWTARLTLHTPEKSVQPGDLICTFNNMQTPIIIRRCEHYFSVVMVGAKCPESVQMEGGESRRWAQIVTNTALLPTRIPLLWDWGNQADSFYHSTEFWRLLEIPLKYSFEQHHSPLDIPRLIQPIWLENMALLLERLGDSATAVTKLQEADQVFEKLIGSSHLTKLKLLRERITNYSEQADWKSATVDGLALLKLHTEIFGPQQSGTLTTMLNLADFNSQLGLWHEAATLYLSVHEGKVKLLGQDHPESIEVAASLSGCYIQQKHWAQAADCEENLVLKHREITLGRDHPLTLRSMEILSATYGSLVLSAKEPATQNTYRNKARRLEFDISKLTRGKGKGNWDEEDDDAEFFTLRDVDERISSQAMNNAKWPAFSVHRNTPGLKGTKARLWEQ